MLHQSAKSTNDDLTYTADSVFHRYAHETDNYLTDSMDQMTLISPFSQQQDPLYSSSYSNKLGPSFGDFSPVHKFTSDDPLHLMSGSFCLSYASKPYNNEEIDLSDDPFFPVASDPIPSDPDCSPCHALQTLAEQCTDSDMLDEDTTITDETFASVPISGMDILADSDEMALIRSMTQRGFPMLDLGGSIYSMSNLYFIFEI